MLKKLIVILPLILFSIEIYANNQDDSNKKDELSDMNDSVLNDEGAHFLMFSLSYSTNNTKNKNYLDVKMPTMMGDIYFFAKNGLWASASYSNYIDAPKATYETEFSIGYQTYVGSFFDVDFSYKWHQFKGDTLYSGIDYNHALILSSGVDFDIFNFYIDNSLYWGSSKNYFLDLSLGLNLEGDHFIWQDDNISLSPTLLASFGTNDFIYYDIIPRQLRYKGRIYNLPPKITENVNSEFIYQSAGFILPLLYSIGEFSFSFAWSYIIPSNRLKELLWTDQSGFFISVTYSPNIF